MNANAIADAVGLSILAVAVALPISCAPMTPAATVANLQPLVATAGAYGVIAAQVAPTPTPTPPVPTVGCEPGCKCNGTGKEKSGDGLAIVGCRCPDSCKCKQAKKAAVPTQGVPGWPPKNLDR